VGGAGVPLNWVSLLDLLFKSSPSRSQGQQCLDGALTAGGVVEGGRKFPASGTLDENLPYHVLCDVNFGTRFGSSRCWYPRRSMWVVTVSCIRRKDDNLPKIGPSQYRVVTVQKRLWSRR
jgi:hypothetical protein